MITREKTVTITPRISMLREKVMSSKPTVCTERARFYTRIYQEHEDKPVIMKRALALEKTLREMSLFIDEGELIVGNHSSGHRAAPIFPEYAVDWLPEEMDDAALEAKLFPRAPGSEAPRPRPDVAYIHRELRRPGVTPRTLSTATPERGGPRRRTIPRLR